MGDRALALPAAAPNEGSAALLQALHYVPHLGRAADQRLRAAVHLHGHLELAARLEGARQLPRRLEQLYDGVARSAHAAPKPEAMLRRHSCVAVWLLSCNGALVRHRPAAVNAAGVAAVQAVTGIRNAESWSMLGSVQVDSFMLAYSAPYTGTLQRDPTVLQTPRDV